MRPPSSWGMTRASRVARGSKRGRPRGSRHAFMRRPEPKPADNAVAVAAGMYTFSFYHRLLTDNK